VLYIGVTVVLMGVLPAERLASSNAPFADAAQVLLGAGLGSAIAVCIALRATGCLTGWMLVTAETSRGAADVGDFPAFFRTRPGERASLVGLMVPGLLMTVVALLSARPNLAQQFSTLANATSLLCLYTYILAAASLIRLSGGRLRAVLSSILAIAGALALIASGKPLELALSALPILGAGLLYLWLRRR
jgi:amino acid transporter